MHAPLGMHPDQHAIAFAGGNPNIAFIGSDGGVVRTSGSFVDFSADCASRGISGNQLIRCLEWLAAVPSRIDSLNEGLRTLQVQSVSLNRPLPSSPSHCQFGRPVSSGQLIHKQAQRMPHLEARKILHELWAAKQVEELSAAITAMDLLEE